MKLYAPQVEQINDCNLSQKIFSFLQNVNPYAENCVTEEVVAVGKFNILKQSEN